MSIRKIMGYLLSIVFIILLGDIIYILSQNFRKSNNEIANIFRSKNLHFEIINNDTLRYIKTGNSNSEKAILFIHGAPGGLDTFNPYLTDEQLNANYTLFSIDRLGYGYSHFGNAALSIPEQAQPIINIINQYPEKKWTIVGHSYGGAIAAYLAYKNPSMTEKLILIGAAADPEKENFVNWAKVGNLFLIKPILSNAWKVATEEKLSHSKQLTDINNIWPMIKVPTIVLHGTDDRIVPYENALFIENKMNPKYLELVSLKNLGHLFLFSKTDILLNYL